MNEPRPVDVAINQLKRTHAAGTGRASIDPEPDLTAEDDSSVELIWPPPGLEHLHGLLTRVTGSLYLAALILLAAVALPLLRDRPPEAGSWGTVVAFTIVGIMLFAAYMWLMVMFNRAATGVGAGYPRELVWQVAADAARTTMQTLHGTGRYDRLSIAERTTILRARVTASFFALAGALWLTAGLPLLLVVGTAGWIRTQVFWLTALLPAVFCIAVATYYRVEELRRDYGNRIPDEDDREIRQQATGWRRLYERSGHTLEARRPIARYRLGAIAAGFGVFVILVPIAIAAFTTIVTFVLPGNADFYAAMVRRNALAPLRAYRLATDSAVTPIAAGEAYHRLVMWDGKPASELKPAAARSGREVAVLARAQQMDFAGARWTFPREPGRPPWLTGPAGYHPYEAAIRYINTANRLLENGRADSAELKVKEVISAGFLIADESLVQWDANRGASMVQIGADALAKLYRRTGRAAEAESIDAVIGASSTGMQTGRRLGRGSSANDLSLRVIMFDRAAPRAIRWDAYITLATQAHCGSITNLVFGPGERFERLRRAAHDALVRYPSEEQYFRLASRGFMTSTAPRATHCDFDWIVTAIRGY